MKFIPEILSEKKLQVSAACFQANSCHRGAQAFQAPWASCAAAAWRTRGTRSSRRRRSHRSHQLRQKPASSAAPRLHRRGLRSSSPGSTGYSVHPAYSAPIEWPRRVVVSGPRPPRCAILRSTGSSATRPPAATAPSSRRRAVLTREARAVPQPCRTHAECASRPPAHRTCLRRRAARAGGPPTVRAPYANQPRACRALTAYHVVHPRWRSPSSTPRTGWRAAG